MAITPNQQGQLVKLADLLIDVSADDNASDYITAEKFFNCSHLLFAHRGTATGALTVAILPDTDLDETADASWVALEHEMVAVDIPDASAQVIPTPPCAAIRIESAGTEAGDRTIEVWGRRGS